MTNFLFDGPVSAEVTILLAHGAGAPMNSVSMNAMANALSAVSLRVARFEFAYMAARRTSNARPPPPRAEKLIPEYRHAIETLEPSGSLIIGGKSMGGRVASMLADEVFDAGLATGLLCLGYPFHPIGKAEQLRTAHLASLQTPTLIAQGSRDLFGTREEVVCYDLSPNIEMLWLEDGDHDLRPRKSVSGFSAADHLETLAKAASTWAHRIAVGRH